MLKSVIIMETTNFTKCWISVGVLILMLLLGLASAMKYKLEVENEEIFTECRNQPSNFRNITEFFNFSEFQSEEIGNKIQISGNLTSTWNYDPTDRIEGTATLFRYDRGEWTNSLVSVLYNDLCSELFDENKHIYKFWTKHVVNVKDTKGKCLLNGTKFIHETFPLDFTITIPAIGPGGRHKLVFVAKTFDKDLNQRDEILCFEIVGEVSRSNI